MRGTSWARVAAIAQGVVADALRRRVPYVVLAFAGLLAVAIPSLPSYNEGVDAAVYREVALALTFVAALVVTLSLTVNRVPSEIERRVVYSVLARPASRTEYVVGTWAGVAVVMGGLIGAFTLLEQALGLAVYGDPMWRLWQGALGVWMEVCVLSAFALALSAATGAVAAAAGSLTLLFVGHSRSALLSEGSPLALVYPSLEAFNVIDPVAHGAGVQPAYVVTMVLAFAAWVIALLALAALLFNRRDL
ncbi:MAG: hypothetical protein IBX62_01635 [Coriobacteriia bacterium]|nr:hypothetical protein [Coriobacteriia bacterium]